MFEVWYVNQQLADSQILGIDAALHAQYPAYIGLNYQGGQGILRLGFTAEPTEEVQAEAVQLVNLEAVQGPEVEFNMEVSTLWL